LPNTFPSRENQYSGLKKFKIRAEGIKQRPFCNLAVAPPIFTLYFKRRHRQMLETSLEASIPVKMGGGTARIAKGGVAVFFGGRNLNLYRPEIQILTKKTVFSVNKC